MDGGTFDEVGALANQNLLIRLTLSGTSLPLGPKVNRRPFTEFAKRRGTWHSFTNEQFRENQYCDSRTCNSRTCTPQYIKARLETALPTTATMSSFLRCSHCNIKSTRRIGESFSLMNYVFIGIYIQLQRTANAPLNPLGNGQTPLHLHVQHPRVLTSDGSSHCCTQLSDNAAFELNAVRCFTDMVTSGPTRSQ